VTAPRPDLDALLAHADWLHRLGQQLAKDHHAAADAAQDALLAATSAPPVHGQNLRGYLARALRNLLLLQQRRQQRRRAREQEASARGATSASSGAELVERAELHQFLGQCVLELPEPQRSLVLRHYFEGTPIAALATMQLSSDAIRAHLRRARDSLRQRLEGGDRPPASRAFASLLTTAAATPTAALLAMTTTKLLGGATIAAILLIAWATWPNPNTRVAPSPIDVASRIAQAEPRAASVLEPTTHERVPAPAAVTATATGDLALQVLWSDGSVGSDLRILVCPDLDDLETDRCLVTDRSGRLVVPGLTPATGQLSVENRLGSQFVIEAGRTTQHTVQLRAGVTVHGIVVDERAAPLPSARVWLSFHDRGDEGLELGPVAADGTFTLRDLPTTGCFVAAVAPGKRVSTLVAVIGQPLTTQHVRIELHEPGVTLLGQVRRADGSPARGVRVLVGDRANRPYFREEEWRRSRPPLDLRSDELGRFRADGLSPGRTVRVWLRAQDLAPAGHEVQLPAAGNCAEEFVLTAGATVRGIAVDGDDVPASGVTIVALPTTRLEVLTKTPSDPAPAFAQVTTQTDEQGQFVLRRVPPGAITLLAKRHQPVQTAAAERTLCDGDDVVWNPQLNLGATIRGEVRDESGRPLAGWRVQAVGEGAGQQRNATTDASGGFTLPDCGEQDWRLTAEAPGAFSKFPCTEVLGVTAGTQDLRIVVPSSAIPAASVHGRVQRSDGQPATKARLWLWSEAHRSVEVVPELFDGVFQFGLLPPGVWRACAECDGRRSPWTERIVLRDGSHDLGVLVIGDGGTADITVQSAAGDRLDGVACRVLGAIEDQDVVVAAGVAKQGRLRFEGLPAGPHRVRVVDRNHPRCEVAFQVEANSVATPIVVVPSSVVCTLVTQPARPGGLQRFTWRWVRDGAAPLDETEWISTRGEHQLLRHLAPGDYVLTITASDGAQVEQRLTIRADDPLEKARKVRLP
jgi:RNA polymerase sigma factor (sigma-70 family)